MFPLTLPKPEKKITKMNWILSLFLFSFLLGGIASLDQGRGQIVSNEELSNRRDAHVDRQLFRPQRFSYITVYSFTTTTKAVALTCYPAAAAAPAPSNCFKRKRRTAELQDPKVDSNPGYFITNNLDGSLSHIQPDESVLKKGRLGITVWSTTTSLLTVTTTTTNTGVTFRVSYMCTYDGFPVPGLCPG